MKTTTSYLTKLESFSKFLAVLTAATLPLSTTATGVLFILTVVVNFASGGWRDKFFFIFHHPVARMFLVFFALFLLGLTYTRAPLSEALHVLSKYDKFLLATLLMPLFRDEKVRNHALQAFMWAMVIVLVCAYLKAFGVIKYGVWYGPVEIFKGHISFSFLMGFTAYLAALRWLQVKTLIERVILTIFILLIIYELLFLGISRSGYFVLFGLTLVFCVQKMRWWRGIIVGVISVTLLVGTAWFFSGVFKGKLTEGKGDVASYNATHDTSIGTRMYFVENSLILIKAHPFFGSGTGSFKSQYNQLPNVQKITIANPHDEYLHEMIQFGVLGLVVLLALFGTQLWYSRRLPPDLNSIAQALVITMMIGCCANSWLLDTTPGHVYAFFMALTFAAL